MLHSGMTTEELVSEWEVPEHLVGVVLVPPRMLEGESLDDYFTMMDLMVEEILPETNVEWLTTVELANLWWEIRRYMRWKNTILVTHRNRSLENALLEIDPDRIAVGAETALRVKARLAVRDWHSNPAQRAILEARLQAQGYDDDALNAGAMMEGAGSLATIEKFMKAARSQLTVIMREVHGRREFAVRVKKHNEQQMKVEERRGNLAEAIGATN